MPGSLTQLKLRWFDAFAVAVLLFHWTQQVHAIDLDINDTDSIKKAASTIAYDLVTFYQGNQSGQIPGYLPQPYYWWEAGAMFGTLVNYWYLTGDSSYNDITTQALLFQATSNGDFMPTNQTRDEGNDDQSFWALSAMMAAERNFPNPPAGSPSWLEMVQAVFNEQVTRWNTESCGGGLKWQIFPFNNGYDYRNSIANGCFFDIAARLARYTGNQSYADWAEKAWDWVTAIGLVGDTYQVYDGTTDTNNCSTLNHVLWTYNSGIYLHGAATMYSFTNGSSVWEERINGLLNASAIFFSTNASSLNVMYEYSCELINDCTTDQFSFKAYLSRWMADTTQLAPFTRDTIMTKLEASATAAAKQCVGGSTGTYCGMKWTTGTYDGTTGVGQQMSALETVQGLLMPQAQAPLTNSTGGTSKSNPDAGLGSSSNTYTPSEIAGRITTGDRVGAGIITVVLVLSVFGCAYVMVS